MVNDPVISSTTDDNDDINVLPFERIGKRVSSESANADDDHDRHRDNVTGNNNHRDNDDDDGGDRDAGDSDVGEQN